MPNKILKSSKRTLVEIKNLWIGDQVLLQGSNKNGTFEGVNAEGKVRVKVNGKILLTSPSNIAPYEVQIEEDLSWLFEDAKPSAVAKKAGFDTTIDLHVEILAPHLTKAIPSRILDHQVNAFKTFLDKAISLKVGRITVIHGKGEGVLRNEIHTILEKDSRISLKTAINGDGATEIWL